MRRIAATLLLLLGVVFAGTASHAQTTTPTPTITEINGACFQAPANTLIPCPASPTATQFPRLPEKTLSVSAPVAGPANTSTYTVSVTSRFLCFALNEPVLLYVLGSPSVTALTELFPQVAPFLGYPVQVNVDPLTGTASLSLEVFNAEVGPAGLDLKAVWPQERIERVVNVIPPAPPTATATPPPGQPTSTATPVPPTATATATAAVTATVTATATSSATATPTPSLFARACVTPNPVPGATTATLYGQTLPGAGCFSSITFNDGTTPIGFTDGTQTAGSDGVVSWTFTASSTATAGTATVVCSLAGQTVTATAPFIVIPVPVSPGPTGGGAAASGSPIRCSTAGGVQATAGTQLPSVRIGQPETVFGCLTQDGHGVSNVSMSVRFRFASGEQFCFGITDANGIASCSKSTSFASIGETVVVDVSFIYNAQVYSAQTSFTVI